MLKTVEPVNNLASSALEMLNSVLQQVPALQIQNCRLNTVPLNHAGDVIVDLNVNGRPHCLVCGVTANGQPRHVRMALLQLRDQIADVGPGTSPVVIAPYLSPEAQALCRQAGASFLDLEGNARIVFDGVYVERSVPHKPSQERRELRSLFKPKSAQVLIVLLDDPQRAWRVTDLAAAAGVSLGHVSNVRAGLVDREWGRVSDQGLFLAEPGALLDAWREAYRPPVGPRLARYSPLHGAEFEKCARGVLQDMNVGRAVLASFSAARWLAPYGKSSTEYFYADETGVERLTDALKLTSPALGENVVITVPKDPGLFRNCVEPAPGAVCTGIVQTYLDLTLGGERGREAADHLRRERLTWQR